MRRVSLVTIMVMGIVGGVAGKAAAAPATLLPGEWQTSSAMQMQAMPGMPPEVAAMMRQRMGKPTIIRTCITPEQAARGPETRMPNGDCTVDRMRYSAGRMVSEMQCRRDGQVTRMTMAGSYTPTSYVMDGQMTSSGGGSQGMAMTMHVTGRRVSPVCSAAAK